MRTSFPSATLRSHGSQSGGERAGIRYHEPSFPHIYSEASVVHRFHRMLLSLGKDRVSVQLWFGCFAISDRPSSPSFPCTPFSDTQGPLRLDLGERKDAVGSLLALLSYKALPCRTRKSRPGLTLRTYESLKSL
ncbi:hypothetical protein MKW94_016500 [Papaver nudicaule]|uniref:Uncharacterized protein n=1 Tax=Papaver nudicaule TaxID=74823 RepID=A0AA41W283_PAPNU|nr:hypothetical protein [Papaver nudicaule]